MRGNRFVDNSVRDRSQLGQIQQEMQRALENTPGFEGLRRGPGNTLSFRIFSESEFNALTDQLLIVR